MKGSITSYNTIVLSLLKLSINRKLYHIFCMHFPPNCFEFNLQTLVQNVENKYLYVC